MTTVRNITRGVVRSVVRGMTEGVGDGYKGGGDGFIVVQDDGFRINRLGQVTAPAAEGPTWVGRS